MIEQIMIPSKMTKRNTNAVRASNGDGPQLLVKNGMVDRIFDSDMERRKKKMRIDGRKNAMTGRNILDIPCQTRVDSGRTSEGGRRNMGLGCTGTWSCRTFKVSATRSPPNATSLASGTEGKWLANDKNVIAAGMNVDFARQTSLKE